MFESFEETERSRGLKGFLGPVRHAGRAEEGIRRIALFFLSLAAVSATVGVAVYGNTGSLVTGSVLGVAALALYLSRTRTAALILLALVLANALLHLRAPFSWLWVALAARAAQLAFSHRRQASYSLLSRSGESPRLELKSKNRSFDVPGKGYSPLSKERSPS
ncbi:MAG: hypothetical protein ABIS20_10550 [Thermoanaerobaculia bacterium]